MDGKVRILAALLVLLLLGPLGVARAQDPTVENLKLGTHITGEKLDTEDLKEHVVLVYFWDLT